MGLTLKDLESIVIDEEITCKCGNELVMHIACKDYICNKCGHKYSSHIIAMFSGDDDEINRLSIQIISFENKLELVIDEINNKVQKSRRA